MQKHWDLQRDGKSQDIVGTLKRKTPTDTQESLTNDPLDWCLVQMLGEPDNQKGFNHAMLFAMLHEHLASNPSERNRLDEVVYQVLSDLSTCHEMLLAVRLHRPQNKPRTLTETKPSEDRPAWKWLRSCKESEPAFARLNGIGGSLVRDFYLAKAPTGPKTVAWLAQFRPLHSAIEKFWERMRDWMRMDFVGSDFSVVEIDSILQVISANLDNEYLQKREREEAAILSVIDGSKRPDSNFNFLGEVDTYSRPKLDLPRREKTKTRRGGQGDLNDILPPHDTPSNWESEATAPLEQTRATTIKVSKQSLEVFLLMFPEKQTGELPDIYNGMNSSTQWSMQALRQETAVARRLHSSPPPYQTAQAEEVEGLSSISLTSFPRSIRSCCRLWASGWQDGLVGDERLLRVTNLKY
ncbi:hypothetical protein BJX65DRAFT_307556 [Aspergillus insuetus]